MYVCIYILGLGFRVDIYICSAYTHPTISINYLYIYIYRLQYVLCMVCSLLWCIYHSRPLEFRTGSELKPAVGTYYSVAVRWLGFRVSRLGFRVFNGYHVVTGP